MFAFFNCPEVVYIAAVAFFHLFFYTSEHEKNRKTEKQTALIPKSSKVKTNKSRIKHTMVNSTNKSIAVGFIIIIWQCTLISSVISQTKVVVSNNACFNALDRTQATVFSAP